MNTPEANSKHTETQVSVGAGVLWASAIVIIALIITQAGRLSSGNAAFADVSVSEDLTLSTVSAGLEEDVVAIVDRQSEMLYIYGVEQGTTVELFQVHNLRDLFTQGRGTLQNATER